MIIPGPCRELPQVIYSMDQGVLARARQRTFTREQRLETVEVVETKRAKPCHQAYRSSEQDAKERHVSELVSREIRGHEAIEHEQGDSTLKETFDIVCTLASKCRARRRPTAAMAKIDARSSRKIARRRCNVYVSR